MIRQRIAATAVGLPILVLLLFLGNGGVFALAVALVGVLGVQEFYRSVASQTSARPAAPFGWATVALAVSAAWAYTQGLSPFWIAPVFTALVLAALAAQLLRPERAPVRDLGATALGAVYVGVLLPHLILLRGFEYGEPAFFFNWHSIGARLVLFTFLVTWAADTGAYFTGRAIGRHRLCPTLSPGKTVEGFLGGIAAAMLVGVLLSHVLLQPVMPLLLWESRLVASLHGASLGLIFGLLGAVGDLSKSAMKRELKVKDFGAIIPGHGGVLDRFDSLLFVAPVAYYHWLYLLI
jgi:phosphatidate cytidylyltransferase